MTIYGKQTCFLNNVVFFYKFLLLELVDPRHPRSIPIRNPQFIIEAKKKLENKSTINININYK